MKNSRSQAVAVLIRSPDGVPLVMDPKKQHPLYWKLPGGKGIGSETAAECAVREIHQEIGLHISKNELSVLWQNDKSTHTWTVFLVDVPSLAGIRKKGDEREHIRICTSIAEITKIPNLLPSHKLIINNLKKG